MGEKPSEQSYVVSKAGPLAGHFHPVSFGDLAKALG